MATLDLTHLDHPLRLAAAARSILACPSSVHLVVDGVDDVLAGTDELGMQDLGGHPTFSCVPETDLARAAARGARALLTLHSGLGPNGSPDRDATLTLAGMLHTTSREDCDCCGQVRDVVSMRLTFALLSRAGAGRREQQRRVPLDDFRSPALELNRGYLQRSVEHANRCHQEELRRAVATTTGTRIGEVVGVTLVDLRHDRVGVQWVDLTGSQERTLMFARPATSADELGELLRRELHAGHC
ncbi:hypothetical protein [Nocardioides sp.]|uniref:hypothetical protein n=1 Tax=Nocardioides sp. TaxID=35761 RepID=UPI00286BBFB6|nr:hypothetical protein [Nocardioides sp.]